MNFLNRKEMTMEATTNKTLPNPVPVRVGRRYRRVLRRIAIGFGIVIALIASLALAGAGYEAIAAGGDIPSLAAALQERDKRGCILRRRENLLCARTAPPLG